MPANPSFRMIAGKELRECRAYVEKLLSAIDDAEKTISNNEIYQNSPIFVDLTRKLKELRESKS